MALLLSDGFSLYNNSTTALKIKGWSAFSSPNYLQAGRWGAGSYSVVMTSTSNTYFSQALTISGSTTIMGMGFSVSSAVTGSLATINTNSVTVSFDIVNSSSNYLLRVRNQTTSTTLFTSVTQYTTSTFYYLEMKIIWGTGGSGRIIFKVDSAVIYDSGATLTLATAASTATFTLGASSGVFGTFTDLLIMDGSGANFNDFQGDVRIETLRPSGDGANSGWSFPNNTLLTDANQSRITTSASGWAGLSGSPTLSRTASGGPDLTKFVSYLNVSSSTATFSIISSPNGTSGYSVTPGQTLGIGLWHAVSGGAPTVTVAARFYDSGGSQVGSDLSFGTISPGANTWVFQNPASSVTVPASSATCAIALSFTSNSSTYRFTGFVLSTNSATPSYVDPTAAHYLQTNDQVYDSDTSYVKNDVAGTKESYAMTDMSANGAILGVRPVIVARKETSGAQRSIATMVRISGTDYVNASTNVVPSNLAYTAFSNLQTVSPATSTTWTKTEVNGMEAGFSITE